MLTEEEWCDPVSKRSHHRKKGGKGGWAEKTGVGQERFEIVGSV